MQPPTPMSSSAIHSTSAPLGPTAREPGPPHREGGEVIGVHPDPIRWSGRKAGSGPPHQRGHHFRIPWRTFPPSMMSPGACPTGPQREVLLQRFVPSISEAVHVRLAEDSWCQGPLHASLWDSRAWSLPPRLLSAEGRATSGLQLVLPEEWPSPPRWGPGPRCRSPGLEVDREPRGGLGRRADCVQATTSSSPPPTTNLSRLFQPRPASTPRPGAAFPHPLTPATGPMNSISPGGATPGPAGKGAPEGGPGSSSLTTLRARGELGGSPHPGGGADGPVVHFGCRRRRTIRVLDGLQQFGVRRATLFQSSFSRARRMRFSAPPPPRQGPTGAAPLATWREEGPSRPPIGALR